MTLIRHRSPATLALVLSAVASCSSPTGSYDTTYTSSMAPSEVLLKVGETATLTASVGNRVTGATLPDSTIGLAAWKSDDEAVARLTSSNRGTAQVIGVAPGRTTVSLRASVFEKNPNLISGAIYAKSTIVVTAAPAEAAVSALITPTTGDLNVGESLAFGCTALDRNGQVIPGAPVTWGSSAPGIATVSAIGTVVGVAAGNATITCAVTGTTVTTTRVVVVHPYIVTVTPTVSNITVGEERVLNASVTDFRGRIVGVFLNQLSWQSSDAAAVSITVPPTNPSNPTVRGLTAGRSSTITATYAVGSATGSAVVNVNGLSVSITGQTTMAAGSSVLLTVTVRDAAGNVVAGPTLTFGSNSNGQLVVLSSTATSVVVRGLTPGAYQFTVTATANGQTGSATVTLTTT